MEQNKVKTSIAGLKPGMYVAQLDRPWLETPFALEGLLIQSSQEIEMLARYCSYVYVDVEKGDSPELRFWATGGTASLTLEGEEPEPVQAFPDRKETEYEQLRRCFYDVRHSLETEMPAAKETRQLLDTNIAKMFDDLTEGRSLDVSAVKQGIEAMVDSVVRNPSAFTLLLQLERSDHYAYGRSLATSVWCAQFGRHLGLEREDVCQLALGGMLLDVGKVKVPTPLLNKYGRLSEDEMELVRKHVDYSVRILASTNDIPPAVLSMVATHHERADGSGYPQGLHNDEIPIFGRIAGIVDTYDAMTVKRPYDNIIYAPHEAISQLYDGRGTIFQSELIEQFIQTVEVYPTGTLVEFESGEIGIVIAVNDTKRLFPTVMLVLDSDKQPMPDFRTINLSQQSEIKLRTSSALPRGAYGIRMDELFL